ncbi:MAG TPA: hypothetical protein VL309_05300 [Vicinamibacterales bacterium]|nr:hypothetical protein [Vicinamibacterales bacterium]
MKRTPPSARRSCRPPAIVRAGRARARRCVAVAAFALVFAAAASSGAQSATADRRTSDIRPVSVIEEVPVPGGIAAAAAAFGLNPSSDRGEFVADLTRTIYDTTELRNASVDAWLASVHGAPPAQPGDVVPLPLTAAVWGEAVFRSKVAPAGLLAAIVADRRASFLCRGLTALDDETLAFLGGHPSLVRRLYERDASVFAVFSSGLRVRAGRVVVPGAGDAAPDVATPLWEALVGEKVSQPEKFISTLYSHGEGRLAYLYDAIAQLDPPHARFAIGAWIDGDAMRRDRFLALGRGSDSGFREWHVRTLPFSRPIYDLATALDRIRVAPSGEPAPPAGRAFWARAFGSAGGDLAGEGGTIDAAWLADEVSGPLHERTDRFNQILFAQRVFGGLPTEQLGDAASVVQAMPRCLMLVLALERMGIRAPSRYAAAARVAARLSELDGPRGFAALGEFQATIALLSRMSRVGSLEPAARDAALDELLSLPVGGGGYDGALTAWIARTFPEADAGVEDALISRLAGPANAGPPTSLEWEGQRYHVDMAASERKRLTRIREKQGKPSLDVAVAIARAAERAAAAEDPARAAAALGKLAPDLPSRDRAAGEAAYGEGGRSPQEIIERAGEELGRVHAGDKARAARAAEPLRALADRMTAEALLSLAYAVEIADPDSTVLLAGNVARRHDFGLNMSDGHLRLRTEWGLPKPDVAPGVPWHVVGSALGLDIALAPLALRRLDSSGVETAPRLTSNERQTFAATVALLNPYAMTDADRDGIAAAVARGRERVDRFAADQAAFAQAAQEIGLDARRRRAAAWTLAHEPGRAPQLFSLTELMYLGGIAESPGLDAWGTAALPASGCLCTQMPRPGAWARLIGRPQLGLMGTAVADLNLHVALTLKTLGLPAAITRYVLAAAMQDFIDTVAPSTSDDWLALVRAAGRVPRERIEDYVAAATADGPLVPDR